MSSNKMAKVIALENELNFKFGNKLLIVHEEFQ